MKANVPETVLIIPAYNEDESILRVVNSLPKEYNIVCIDDGSTDSTADEIRKTRAELVVHPINMGQGAALQTGLEYALQNERNKYFVTFDADGQHRFEDVENMLKVIRQKNVDIVMGSRFLGKAINMPMLKKIILRLAIMFSNLTSGVKLTDTHNGLRVLNRHAASTLNLKMPDFSHASEIVNKIGSLDLKYCEVPVTIIYTDYSRSKGQSLINAVNIAFDVIFSRVLGK